MMYQFPQPWLQTYWHSQIPPAQTGNSMGGTTGVTTPGFARPMRQQPNAFASPATMFGGQRKRKPGMGLPMMPGI